MFLNLGMLIHSNRLYISLSTPFFETSNPRGAKPPSASPSNEKGPLWFENVTISRHVNKKYVTITLNNNTPNTGGPRTLNNIAIGFLSLQHWNIWVQKQYTIEIEDFFKFLERMVSVKISSKTHSPQPHAFHDFNNKWPVLDQYESYKRFFWHAFPYKYKSGLIVFVVVYHVTMLVRVAVKKFLH